jgi:hypothetical protein
MLSGQRWDHETGKNRGRLCGQRLVIGGVGESGVPASVVVGEGVVEDSGADLEQGVGAVWCPPHLLLFDHAFADYLVDGGLDAVEMVSPARRRSP